MNPTRIPQRAALVLLAVAALVAAPVASASSLAEDALPATAGGVSPDADVEVPDAPLELSLEDLPLAPSVPTVMASGGLLVMVNTGALASGGRVLYAGGPAGMSVSVDRMVGGTDGVAVKAGPLVEATYAERMDRQNDTWQTFAMSVGNNAWMVFGVDPDNREHYSVLGWYTLPSTGTVGQSNLDPWAVICASFVCVWKS